MNERTSKADLLAEVERLNNLLAIRRDEIEAVDNKLEATLRARREAEERLAGCMLKLESNEKEISSLRADLNKSRDAHAATSTQLNNTRSLVENLNRAEASSAIRSLAIVDGVASQLEAIRNARDLLLRVVPLDGRKEGQ
ncbi:MAG: hypothetical protein IPK72_21210 [Candidatus Eisenbacteria bacterium]|nr:hypothetical protein [Candidatus Eisenbacteria bacterium]